MFKGVIFILLLMTFGCSRVGKERIIEKDKFFNLCDFPNSIEQAVVKKLKKKCESVLPEDVIEITHLKIENVSEQDVKLLSKKYAMYFLTLEDLDMSDNPNMLVLPEFIVYLPKLKKLNISRTGVNTFSQNISQLSTLTTLIASHNSYENQEPPLTVFSLVDLKVLDMSYSSIRYIDEYIYKLENLEELYLAGNQLMVVPFMLQLMPRLLLIDLRDNSFGLPLDSDSVLDESLNTLHTCKGIEDDSDRESCQEDMLDNFRCEWWYKLPFKRGKSFRRYKEMTNVEFEAFTAEGQLPSKDRCYLWWLNSKYMSLTESEKAVYLERTINGKTRRELQILLPAYIEHWGGWYGLNALVGVCEYEMLFADTSYLFDSQEVFPEDYYAEGWTEYPKECEMDKHLYKDHPLYEQWVEQLNLQESQNGAR